MGWSPKDRKVLLFIKTLLLKIKELPHYRESAENTEKILQKRKEEFVKRLQDINRRKES